MRMGQFCLRVNQIAFYEHTLLPVRTVQRSEPEGNGPLDERATMHANELKSQNLTSDLKSETSITLVFMCMLPLIAILVASEVMAASKRPRRSHLASELSSMTSITHVAMLIWPLSTAIG